MKSTGLGRLITGIVVTVIAGVLVLRGVFVLVLGAPAWNFLILILWALILALGIALIVRGMRQRSAYLSGTHSTDQRSADLS